MNQPDRKAQKCNLAIHKVYFFRKFNLNGEDDEHLLSWPFEHSYPSSKEAALWISAIPSSWPFVAFKWFDAGED